MSVEMDRHVAENMRTFRLAYVVLCCVAPVGLIGFVTTGIAASLLSSGRLWGVAAVLGVPGFVAFIWLCIWVTAPGNIPVPKRQVRLSKASRKELRRRQDEAELARRIGALEAEHGIGEAS